MRKLSALVVFISLILGLCSFVSSEVDSRNKFNSQEFELMLGEIQLEDLKTNKNRQWFISEYDAYSPKADVIKEISAVLKKKNLKISVYMGTWCPDSRREVPHLINILNKADFNLKNLSIIGVDRDKVVPEVTDEKRKQLNINNVPTIIIYNKKGKELNRFVEFAQESLEEDLLKIISGQDYKHVYDF